MAAQISEKSLSLIADIIREREQRTIIQVGEKRTLPAKTLENEGPAENITLMEIAAKSGGVNDLFLGQSVPDEISSSFLPPCCFLPHSQPPPW